jgi:hypothetical protein
MLRRAEAAQADVRLAGKPFQQRDGEPRLSDPRFA